MYGIEPNDDALANDVDRILDLPKNELVLVN